MRNRVKAALSVNPACLNPSTFLPDVHIVSKVILMNGNRVYIYGGRVARLTAENGTWENVYVLTAFDV